MDKFSGRRPQPKGKSLSTTGEHTTAANAIKQPTAAVVASRKNTRFAKLNRRQKITIAAVAIIAAIAIIALSIWWLNSRNQEITPAAPSEVARQYQQQLPGLKKSVEDKPQDAGVRRSYAVALYVSGDLKEAQQQYEEAIKLNDKDATLHNNLGNTYRDLKQYDKAVESYQEAIILDNQSQNAYANLANVQLYSLEKPNDAIETYKKAIKAMPNNTQMKLLLAIAYEQVKNKPEAINTYKDILVKDSKNEAAQNNLDRLSEK